nr:MAG TPA: hypothetical protein [Caudoviricetes sp.]
MFHSLIVKELEYLYSHAHTAIYLYMSLGR